MFVSTKSAQLPSCSYDSLCCTIPLIGPFFFRSFTHLSASISLSDGISVLIEDVCTKLKPDWVKFSCIGMQLLTDSQTEQMKHNDVSLPLPLALQKPSSRIKMSLQRLSKRRSRIKLKIAGYMCSGPERMTLTDYWPTFFKARADVENKIGAFDCTTERHDHTGVFLARARRLE